jgi:hypothetical protein
MSGGIALSSIELLISKPDAGLVTTSMVRFLALTSVCKDGRVAGMEPPWGMLVGGFIVDASGAATAADSPLAPLLSSSPKMLMM